MARRGDSLYHKVEVTKSAKFTVLKCYTNLKQIGKGSYGIVCSADDSTTGKPVAIKKVKKVFEDLVDAKRILREIKLLMHLGSHENVTSLKDIMIGPPDVGDKLSDFKDLYIVTELFECDLDRIISSSQKLTDSHFQYFVYQMLRGLLWVHSASVIHRDLKPANLLVKSNCDMAICDFGLARGVPEATGGPMTDYVQTRWYRAPELLCDNSTYDAQVDVWSAGLIFAELLMREPVLKGNDYLHQLQLIVDLIGKPKAADMKHLKYESAKTAIKNLKDSECKIKRRFGHIKVGGPRGTTEEPTNPLALDLIEGMLKFNPKERLTVKACLEHPYLATLHDSPDEDSSAGKFDHSFEDGYKEEMPKNLLQKHMRQVMKEIKAIRPGAK